MYTLTFIAMSLMLGNRLAVTAVPTASTTAQLTPTTVYFTATAAAASLCPDPITVNGGPQALGQNPGRAAGQDNAPAADPNLNIDSFVANVPDGVTCTVEGVREIEVGGVKRKFSASQLGESSFAQDVGSPQPVNAVCVST